MSRLRAAYVVESLLQLAGSSVACAPPAASAASDQERLNYAEQNRAQMHAAIARGETPEGVRPEFVRSSTRLVLEFLGDIAGTYNAEHPNDAATYGDLLDIIATVQASLRTNSET